MSTFQTLLALVVLIYVLSVIVQALQEVIKSIAGTKANTMAQTVEKFMGAHLTLPQVQGALQKRGLDITALESLNKEDFRSLLDGIEFLDPQLQGIVANVNATLEQKKDNVAAAYEAARASFQKVYTTKNKVFAAAISLVIVLALNANLIMIYQELAADQVMAQAIVGKASSASCSSASNATTQQSDLASTYSANRDCIKAALQNYPILVRSSKQQYGKDWSESCFYTIVGLLLMVFLVSLGAPFWNDILKGVTGINNALNTGGKQAPTS
jgi:hypothetical protein